MNTSNLMKLILFVITAILIGNVQTTIAGSNKFKLFSDCMEDKGWKPDALIDVCTQAIDTQEGNNKNLALAYMMRGIGYRLKHDYDQALDDFTRSIELDPELYDAWSNRVGAWAGKGEFDHAMSDVNKALSMEPKNPYGYYVRSNLWRKMGNLGKAIKDIDHAVKLKPKDPTFLYMSCWNRAIAGIELESALFICTKALKWSRNNVYIFDSRSLVNLRLDKFEDAITDADQALKINPKLAASLFIRGIARLRLGKKEEGTADLATAKELDPDIEKSYADWGVTP